MLARTGAPLALVVLAATACDSSSSTYSFQSDTSSGDVQGGTHAPGGPGAPGDVVVRANPGPKESRRFVVDPNAAGQAAEVRVTRAAYGRLVDVYSLGKFDRPVFQQKDFVVSPDLVSDGVDYRLEEHAVTGATDLVILRSLTTAQGIAEFEALLVAAEAALAPVDDNGLPSDSGVWTMLPRDGALVLQLDDLLDEATVRPRTVRTFVGFPGAVPFEARVLADQNHGDWILTSSGAREFHTTRVVVDLTVESLEALESDPVLNVNPVGLPPATSVSVANVAFRLPSQTTASQPVVLANLAGNTLATTGNGTVDFGSPTLDVVRAARSGGDADDTGDAYNGFLADDTAPRIVTSAAVTLLAPPHHQDAGGPLDYEVRLAFDGVPCARAAERGDALVQPGFVAVVTQRSAAPVGGVLDRVRVRLVHGFAADWEALGMGPAAFRGPFDAVRDAGREQCVPSFVPPALGYPAHPTRGVQPDALVALAFSEPVAFESAPLDGAALTRALLADAEGDGSLWIAADVLAGAAEENGLLIAPALPLTHAQGDAESYWLHVRGAVGGVRDLAGNALVDGVQDVQLTLDPQAADARTYGHVTRFSSADEDPPFGGTSGPLAEWWGQHFYDLARQEIRPRPMTRFEGGIERVNPVTALMTPLAGGTQTPLNPFGAKLQTLWRYTDLGFTYNDRQEMDLDVEGAAWSPIGGVLTDGFPEFEIAVGHAKMLPDEYLDPDSLFPMFPLSGLVKTYDVNVAGQDPVQVVHERSKGYVLSPGDLYTSANGTLLLPLPWNEGVAPGQQTTYTWRDSSLRYRRGANGGGVPQWRERVAYGLPQPANRYNKEGEVRTLGLPFLMEFRCWPDAGAVGLNAFDVSLANNSSSRPYFRAFSAGGIDQSGSIVQVDPDLETEANGGYNPLSNPPGAKTYGLDNVSHIGSLDFVVRVSRSHSVWFPALDGQGGIFAAPDHSAAILEATLPAGTAVAVAYRGAVDFVPQADTCDGSPNLDPLQDARTIDTYGDHYDDRCIDAGYVANHNPGRENQGLTFLNGTDKWLDSPAEVAGARYLQVRLTFLADLETGRTARVSTVALAWGE